jgi:hypothetical protein
MNTAQNGVVVVEMAYTPPEPYIGYMADLCECPACGAQAVKICNAPFWQHGDGIAKMPNVDHPDVYPVFESQRRK